MLNCGYADLRMVSKGKMNTNLMRTSMRNLSVVKEAQTKQSLFCNAFRKRSRKPFDAMGVKEIGHAWT